MTTSTESISFLSLPTEITAWRIGDYLDSESIWSLRSVCKGCKTITDITMEHLWNNLRENAPEGLVDIKKEMKKISADNPNNAHIELFRKLVSKFIQVGARSWGKFPITASNFEYRQDLAQLAQDHAINAIWPVITKMLPMAPQLESVDEKRAWLNDTNNAIHLNGITALKLKGLYLRVLPPEITKFKQLQTLSLSSNQLSLLPETIGTLTRLQTLELSYNKLISLPNTIGACTQLVTLYLNCNKLTSLPNTIGACTKLVNLWLQFNQLSSLPDEIGDLRKLEELIFDDNPLMFIPDKVLTSDLPTIKDDLIISNFQEELAYSSQSPLANLYQSIIRKKTESEIQTLFSNLSPTDKNPIFEMVGVYAGFPKIIDLQSKEQRVFDDMRIFYLAVRESISAKLERLKNEVDLSGNGRVDRNKWFRSRYGYNWNRSFTMDNLPRLADALAYLETHYTSQLSTRDEK